MGDIFVTVENKQKNQLFFGSLMKIYTKKKKSASLTVFYLNFNFISSALVNFRFIMFFKILNYYMLCNIIID